MKALASVRKPFDCHLRDVNDRFLIHDNEQLKKGQEHVITKSFKYSLGLLGVGTTCIKEPLESLFDKEQAGKITYYLMTTKLLPVSCSSSYGNLLQKVNSNRIPSSVDTSLEVPKVAAASASWFLHISNKSLLLVIHWMFFLSFDPPHYFSKESTIEVQRTEKSMLLYFV